MKVTYQISLLIAVIGLGTQERKFCLMRGLDNSHGCISCQNVNDIDIDDVKKKLEENIPGIDENDLNQLNNTKLPTAEDVEKVVREKCKKNGAENAVDDLQMNFDLIMASSVLGLTDTFLTPFLFLMVYPKVIIWAPCFVMYINGIATGPGNLSIRIKHIVIGPGVTAPKSRSSAGWFSLQFDIEETGSKLVKVVLKKTCLSGVKNCGISCGSGTDIVLKHNC
ncbi:hypothetical protein NQ317_007779 [Molorchus minor]|uniref:Uncharacterized protein n=1 Tax=Molorchus minor TaxID=1323400 RepID=A0ABQ9JVS8_9CUCU|nr:hypothetical protein NQ317_007779 [Molorchus minor]